MRACNSDEVSGSGISQAKHRHVLGGLPPGCNAKAMGCRHFGQRWRTARTCKSERVRTSGRTQALAKSRPRQVRHGAWKSGEA